MKVVPQSAALIDHMGTDLTVVNAARVSFDKESEFLSQDPWGANDQYLSDKDEKLINYLAKHNHFTPFTHCSATFRIKVPIFVARQLHKHQVGFTVNEVSRRYVSSEPEFYLPEHYDFRASAENIKQGSGGPLSHGKAAQADFMDAMLNCLEVYKGCLGLGMCAEQARMVLPLNTMTEFFMTGSLYGWARLCKLRLDSHSQKEIRDIAALLSSEMAQLFPVSWGALLET